jgi:dihydropteroate synthase
MGVLNVTPDSFSDGGLFLDTDAAIEQGYRLLAEGADILDIGGESTRPGADPVMAGLVADRGAECCLMHMQGEPGTMQRAPTYGDVVDEVKAFLEERLDFAVAQGVAEERVLLDPGIGFGKTVEHNLELLARLDELASIGRPIVIGTSRKSFLARISAPGEELAVGERLAGTIASNVLAYERGASIFRVHDVRPVAEALSVTAATLGGRWTVRSTGTTRTS